MMLACHVGDCGFESRRYRHLVKIPENNQKSTNTLMVQLEWMSPCHGEDRGFESRWGCKKLDRQVYSPASDIKTIRLLHKAKSNLPMKFT